MIALLSICGAGVLLSGFFQDGLKAPGAATNPEGLSPFEGLIQRSFDLITLVWGGMVSLRLYRLSSKH
jgi:hypothetical protein